MSAELVILILFGSLFGLMLLGVPVSLALGGAGAVYMLATSMSPAAVASAMVSALDKTPVLAIPFFILAAAILSHGGAIRRLVEMFDCFIGHWPGGLAIVTVLATVVFSAMCGSSIATAAAIGVATIPELIRRGYGQRFSLGLVAMAGGLGILIPPSIPLIIYGLITGESITRLFEAGIVPGLLFAALLIAYSLARTWNRPELRRPRSSGPERRAALMRGADVLFLPILILGSMYGGVFTPTEASALAVVYALIITRGPLFERGASSFMGVVAAAGIPAAVILFVLGGAAVFSYALTSSGVPQTIVNGIRDLDLTALQFLLCVNLLLLVLGMFLEVISVMLITVPILFPVVVQLGIDPIHFAIILVINMELAAVTPPVGLNLFTLSTIGKVSVGEVFMGTIPFFMIGVAMLALVTYWPPLSLALAR